ncbi:MAG TPA: hypothetical protein EYG73_02775 [Arcobacter sp.]|nr:hypothetical protein [Arcobacter sp.]
MKYKLENITSNLKINTYKFKDNIFIIKDKSSSALVMKSLIQITSILDKQNIDYSIDDKYNIHILIK